MKRKPIVRLHLIASALAIMFILSFFSFSFFAEFNGNDTLIRQVKKSIFFMMPVMLVVMASLGISGNKLAGKSNNPIVLAKKRRMKFIFFNGLILISLASFLYYRSQYQQIDEVFFVFQIIELLFGFLNLILIIRNGMSGFQLSGKIGKKHIVKQPHPGLDYTTKQ